MPMYHSGESALDGSTISAKMVPIAVQGALASAAPEKLFMFGVPERYGGRHAGCVGNHRASWFG